MDVEARSPKPSGSMPTPDELVAFAARVRDARQHLNLTQEALGQAAGITSSEISRIERGVREPRLLTVFRLARALGLTPSQLLDGIS